MTCPKCQAAMRTYERNGVTIDQCTECRGIFLDRGELERLIDAESAWNAGEPGRQVDDAPSSRQGGTGQGSPSSLGAIVGEVLQQAKGQRQGSGGQGYGGQGSGGQGYPPKRKKKESFLGDLFG